jgi:CBS domain containing-hemolysin-like protein
MTVSLATWFRLFGGVGLLLGNGFFVTTEFAMTRVRQFQEGEFLDHGRGLERAWNMTERLEIFLSGCQVGITICSVGLGVVAEPAVTAVIVTHDRITVTDAFEAIIGEFEDPLDRAVQ